MNKLICIFTIGILFSCDTTIDQNIKKEYFIQEEIGTIKNRVDTIVIEKQNSYQGSEYYILERIPEWFLETQLLGKLILDSLYKFQNRLNPLYLEEDFNGDGYLDVVIPIENIDSKKLGFAIIHGKTEKYLSLELEQK